MKRSLIVIAIVISATACSGLRRMQLVERTSRDTLYLSNVQYDSVYVYNRHSSDYHPSPMVADRGDPDTIYIRDVQYEYKYKLLRDTIYRTHIDTIPVIHEVQVVKRERYVPALYKAILWTTIILIGVISAVGVVSVCKKLRT